MHDRANEVLAIESALNLAIEKNEIFLYYQPLIDAVTSRIIGVEALIRWQHPEWGFVPPSKFIPIAEDSGQIGKIGDWVLRTASKQNANWQAAGLSIVPVAVNLSVVQFRQSDFCEAVQNALSSNGLDPTMIELELTESITMENSVFAIDMLERLHAAGFGLSIDDFGTGYSSLAYLKRFKIDKLKIDQSFVRDINKSSQDNAIVSAIIDLAKNLGFKTIAEGVETQQQVDFLRDNHCDEFQGYYFSKPLPAKVFQELLAKGTIEGKSYDG
jgi:EAL domain-containing protein (putative c-di-GMP-specific phosphodiesterase class I)